MGGAQHNTMEAGSYTLLIPVMLLVICRIGATTTQCAVGDELSAAYQRDGFVVLRNWLNSSQVQTLRDELVAYHRDFLHPEAYTGPAFFRKERHNPHLGNVKKAVRAMDAELPFDRVYNACKCGCECDGSPLSGCRCRPLGKRFVLDTLLDFKSISFVANRVDAAGRARPSVEAMVTSAHFGDAAARLMGAQRVRLYQDSLFFKFPRDAQSSWHKDIDAAPFEASPSQFGTFWISLGENTPQMGSLQFGVGSHKDHCSYWQCHLKCASIEECYRVEEFVLQPGDATFHSGHTFHRAGPNETPHTREGFAVTYFDEEVVLKSSAELKAHTLHNDIISFEEWIGDQYPGKRPETELLPLLPTML